LKDFALFLSSFSGLTNDGLDNGFVDLNYVDDKDNKHIMTFQPIPPKYLEIAKKGIKK